VKVKRVYEIAKEYNISSKSLMAMLKEMNIEIKSHMSTLDENTIKLIENKFKQEEEKVKKRFEKKKMLHKNNKKVGVHDKVEKVGEEKRSEDLLDEELENNFRIRNKKDKFKKIKKIESNIKANNKKEKRDEREIKDSVRKTLAKMSKGKKLKKYKKSNLGVVEEVVESKNVIKVQEFISTGELAALLGVSPNKVIAKALELGIMATINQRLDFDAITIIADEFGYEVELQEDFEDIEEPKEEDDNIPEVERPPIVTIMGHVDHGKTTLLDYIRKSKIVEKESGGITQHIGAYQVSYNGKKITFIDTPGHEAFTTMRARGAQVTDFVILVVAANDGIMPQTIEAINHAKAANVPIIVAINKIDLPEANIDRIKNQLSEYGLIVEEWGGDTIAVPVSAKKGTNIDELLENILLMAELSDLKGKKDKRAKGIVIESKLDRGKGPVATIIVQEGTLKIGDYFVCGYTYGKVRALFDEYGRRVKEATLSEPVQLVGFSEVPQAGDKLVVMESEAEAKKIANKRVILKRERELRAKQKITLENLYDNIEAGKIKELNILIKGDVHGSIEAIAESLLKLSSSEVKINIIHKGVGAITEADVMLASASNAIIIGFNVRPSNMIKELAKQENVEIKTYQVIYDIFDDIKASLKGMLEPKYEEVTTGEAVVRRTFKVPKVGIVAGCYVTNGIIRRNLKVHVIRDGVIIHQGSLASLKRLKDDVTEVPKGYECGIKIEGFNDIKENDIIEQFEKKEIKNE